MKNNLYMKNALKYLTLMLVLYLLLSVTFPSGASPFAVAMLFAYCWCDENIFKISLVYILAGMLMSLNLEFLLSILCNVIILLLSFCTHRLIKKRITLFALVIYSLLAQVVNVYFCYVDVFSFELFIFLLACIVFIIICNLALQALFLRGIFGKRSIDENISIFIILTIIFAGLYSIQFEYISMLKIVVCFSVLFLCSINLNHFAFYVVISSGIGAMIVGGDIMAEVIVLALASSIFTYPRRIFMVLSVLVLDSLYGFFIISESSIYYLFNSILACIVFLLLSRNVIEKFRDVQLISLSSSSAKNIIAVTRKNIRKRVQDLSTVFFDMEKMFGSMINGGLDLTQIKLMLASELNSSVCQDCIYKSTCYKGKIEDTRLAFLVEKALKKGKITLIDMPSALTSRCERSNVIINKINNIVKQYGKYNIMRENIDDAKLLLSQTVGGVSKLLLNLADEIDNNISTDVQRESTIINKLLSKNILVSEILIYNEINNNMTATLIVKQENSFSGEIEKVLSQTLKMQMVIISVVPSERAGWNVCTAKRSSAFDIAFGLSNCQKTGSSISGDSHTMLKISNNKYLVALADGMGSGEKAQVQSSLTIGLLENFYKAGFGSDIVLQSANRLLKASGDDTYSALDIAIFDLDEGGIDIIKVGAPFSLLKHNDNIEKIEGGALPIGVLDQITPAIYKTTISVGDWLIMSTDGVTDAFLGAKNMGEYVSCQNLQNPQLIADNILKEAIIRNENTAKDDMTVLVCKVYKKGKDKINK